MTRSARAGLIVIAAGFAGFIAILMGQRACPPWRTPGAPEVYAEIAATTDCAVLREGFERNRADVRRRERAQREGTGASNNDFLLAVVTSYANAYNRQASAVGCSWLMSRRRGRLGGPKT
ncbi:MAG: hypothetical protein ACT4OS_06820 [Acidimicrobiales bacterium]